MNTDGTPLTVIGGYLGAGKTTLLNHLLANRQGLRIALVVNDFGDINIDAELVASIDGETIALANGCICCTLVDGLAAVLTDLRGRSESIDHVVIEASGVSDPVKIANYGTAFGFAVQGVIVVADAEQIRDRVADKYVGETVVRHLQGADLLVLNKIDLVDAAELAAVRGWLTGLAPAARIVEARHGEVPWAVAVGPQVPRGGPGEGPYAGAPESDHPHFESWSFVSDGPLARADVNSFLALLPENVLRAKGFVCLAEDAEQPYLLQMVGSRATLTPHPASSGANLQTRLVVVGLPGSIDAERFERVLRGTTWACSPQRERS